MRRTASILLAAGLALGAMAVEGEETPELSDHPCYDADAGDLAYPTEQVWFHEGGSKVGNDAPAPWDTTAPEASVTAGAGAGVVSPGTTNLAEGTPADTYAVFAGTFDGCIDTILFDLYSFDPTNRTGTSGSATPGPHNFGMTVLVDGVEVYSAGPLEANTTLANEGVGPNLNQWSLDLRETLELFADFGSLALDGEHTVEVRIRSWYVNTNHSVYVWDTAEVPSGLTFNGAVTDAYPGV